MTVVKRLTMKEMIDETGMDALGYSDPKKNVIYIRKDMPKKVEKHVLGHEAEHMKKGEEGPFLSVGAAIVGGSLISGYLGNKAAKTQAGAANASTAESARQFDLTRKDTAPYREVGQKSLYSIADLLGLGDSGMTPEQLLAQDPGYQFRLTEGANAVRNALGASGLKLSGRAQKELTRYGQNYASGELDRSLDRRFRLAGLGTSGVNTSAQAGSQYASTAGNAALYAGNARAGGYSAINNAIQGGLNNYLTYSYLNNMNQNAYPAGDAYLPGALYG